MLDTAGIENPSERIIVALDCDMDEALRLGESLEGHAHWVKVGMTLFYRYGPDAVDRFKQMGFKVFLDLKLHDIPHQVRGAARSACMSGADMLTVHACGGPAMMQAACEGAQQVADDLDGFTPVLLGITVLTSMDAETLHQVGIERPLDQQVSALGRLALDAGLDGVVASPQEAGQLRAQLGHDAFIVTPGVRPAGSDIGDQSRVSTPRAALDAGSSHLVIGRPITQAPDPVSAFESIAAELSD